MSTNASTDGSGFAAPPSIETTRERLRFLGSRPLGAAPAFDRLATCRTPAEVLQPQLGGHAAADCLAQTRRVIGRMEKAAGENLGPVP